MIAVRGLVARTTGPSSIPLVRLLCLLRLVFLLVLFFAGASSFYISYIDFVLFACEGLWIAIVPSSIADSSSNDPFPTSFVPKKFFARFFLSLKVSSDSIMDLPPLLTRTIPVLLLYFFSFFGGELIVFFRSLYSFESSSTVRRSLARSFDGALYSFYSDSVSDWFDTLSYYLTRFKCPLTGDFVIFVLGADSWELNGGFMCSCVSSKGPSSVIFDVCSGIGSWLLYYESTTIFPSLCILPRTR